MENRSVDLNADLGESFGVYSLGHDQELLKVVTSANVACGFHAGDPTTVRQSVEDALSAGVAVGAHPGFPDRPGFGRRVMELTVDEVYDLVLYQVGALYGVARACGGTLAHVKPHGALYNLAVERTSLAQAIARAVCKVDDSLVLVGLAGSELLAAAEQFGIAARSEVFADRRYQSNGSLVTRSDSRALIEDADESVEQVIKMVRHGTVAAIDGNEVNVRAQTICIHGDGPHAVEFAVRVRSALEAAGVTVSAGLL